MSSFIMLKIVAIKNTVSQHSTSGKAGKVGVLNDSDNPNIDPTDILSPTQSVSEMKWKSEITQQGKGRVCFVSIVTCGFPQAHPRCVSAFILQLPHPSSP